jgi:hypothetical protein
VIISWRFELNNRLRCTGLRSGCWAWYKLWTGLLWWGKYRPVTKVSLKLLLHHQGNFFLTPCMGVSVLTRTNVTNYWIRLHLILFEPQCGSHHRPWRNCLPPETSHTILRRMALPQHLSPVLPELGSTWMDPYTCLGRHVNGTSSIGVAMLKHWYSIEFFNSKYINCSTATDTCWLVWP